jgi:hypothetical protein
VLSDGSRGPGTAGIKTEPALPSFARSRLAVLVRNTIGGYRTMSAAGKKAAAHAFLDLPKLYLKRFTGTLSLQPPR